jgi:outer membrane protein W
MIYAQTAPEAPAGYRAEFQKGSMYTGFRWTPGVGDFSGKLAAEVPSYNGETYDQLSLYGVNYGYFFSTAWAVEGILDFGSSSTEQDITGGGTDKTSSTEFGITVLGKYYFQPKFEDVAAWLGAGITFGSLSATIEETGTATPSKTEFSGTSIGFGIDFGAQYFIGDGFALSANYMLGYMSLSKPEITQTDGNVSTTTKGPSSSQFGTMTGSLGILFYF